MWNAKEYDNVMNEGGEGYSPFRHSDRRAASARQTVRPAAKAEPTIIFQGKPYTKTSLAERLEKARARFERITDEFAKQIVAKEIAEIEAII